jgi:WD40 repeat protein
MSVHQMATDRPPKWAATNKMFTALRGHTSSINALAYRWDKGASPRHILFSGSGDETIRVWDVEQGNCIQELEKSHSGYVSSLLVVDDYLISGSFDRTMCLWNVHRRSLIKSIKAHAHCVNSLFLHDSGVVLSSSWDGHIRLWDLRGKASDKGYVQILKVPDAALCVVGKDNEVFCGLHDSSIAALDLRTGSHRDTFTGHSNYVTALHLANVELFSASADGSVRCTDTRTGNGRTVLDTGLSCFSVYHHVEGPTRWVASGHADGAVRLTNVITGKVVQVRAVCAFILVVCLSATPRRREARKGSGDGCMRGWCVNDRSMHRRRRDRSLPSLLTILDCC